MNFFTAQEKMKSLLSGDIAKETLKLAEDEHYINPEKDNKVYFSNYEHKKSEIARDVPPGEDIKWICGDCMATDWTPNHKRCSFCRDESCQP